MVCMYSVEYWVVILKYCWSILEDRVVNPVTVYGRKRNVNDIIENRSMWGLYRYVCVSQYILGDFWVRPRNNLTVGSILYHRL